MIRVRKNAMDLVFRASRKCLFIALLSLAGSGMTMAEQTGPFRLMAVGDAHITSDLLFGRESLAEAIQHSEQGGPNGAPAFDWDIMVHVGDILGGQGLPTDADGPPVLSQFNSSTLHPRETIYNLAGNHDGSGPGEEPGWWFKKYVDPAGKNTATSGVDNSNRPYPVVGTWERYSFEVGNILFLMMSDRNDGGPPVGRANTGGYPAGAVTLETFNWWKQKVEQNQDKIIVTSHHHVLKETTVASGLNEGIQIATWPQGPQTRYHGKFNDGAPEGSSFLYFVGGQEDPGLFESYLAANPGAIDLWMGGHTHTYPGDTGPGGIFSEKTHIEEKWGVTFANVAALTLHHGSRQKFPLSRLLTFDPGESEAQIQAYLHTDDFAAPGWHEPSERTIALSHPFTWNVVSDDIAFTGGGADPTLAFAADNYSSAPTGTIGPNIAILDDVTMTNITLNATDFPTSGPRRYRMGEGFSLTLDNSTFVTNNNGAISGPHDATPDALGNTQDTMATSDFFLTNGSHMSVSFMDRGAVAHVDSTSTLEIRSGSNPINSHGAGFPSGFTHVELEPGAQITFLSDLDAFLTEGHEILVNGVPYGDGTIVLNPGILNIVGNTATAVALPITGDFDGDGDVDGTDFLKWQRGESPNPFSASDLAEWETNYGTVPPLTGTTPAIPEPSTFTLLALAFAATLVSVRNRFVALPSSPGFLN